MFRVALKSILGHKLRIVLTAVAVILGVAFFSGTRVFTDTILTAFDDLFAEVNANVDGQVRGAQSVDDPFGGEERAEIPAPVLQVIEDAEGVSSAAGTIEGWAVIIDADGKALNAGPNSAPPLGFNWTENELLNPLRLVEGEAPLRADDVVIDRATADETDYGVGDEVLIQTKAGTDEYTVSGIATFGSTDSPLGATIAVFTSATAQRVLGSPTYFDSVEYTAEEGVDESELRENVIAALDTAGYESVLYETDPVPPNAEVQVLTGDEVREDSQDTIRESLGFFNTFLTIFVVVALVVSAFVIYNSFSITVAQRLREMALLRAIGARRRQVLGAVLLEALVTGLVASALGLVLGIGIASGLQALMQSLGVDIPGTGAVIEPATVISAFLVGVLVTLISAVLPARRASRVPPIAALRDVALGGSFKPFRRTVIAAVVLALGIVSIVAGLFGDGGVALVGLGAFVVFIGVAVLSPVIAQPVARVLGAEPVGFVVIAFGAIVLLGGALALIGGIVDLNPFLVVFGALVLAFGWAYVRSGVAAQGMSGKLGRENALRNPLRMARTGSALMIGIGLVAFITIFAASARASVEDIIGEQVIADFVVSSTSFEAGLPPELAEELQDVPGVAVASGVRGGAVEVYEPDAEPGDEPVRFVSAVDPTLAEEVWDLGFIQGSADAIGPNQIGVWEDRFDDFDAELGDTIDIGFLNGGRQTLEIVAVYENNELANDYVVSFETWEANVADQFDFIVAVKAEPGTDLDALRADLEVVTDRYPVGELETAEEFGNSQADQINAILNLVYGLLAFAIIISAFGIANTLALSIFERTRELGLLRAVGMSRSQMRRMVRWEAVIVALFGTGLGVLIGVFFGWILVEALGDLGFGVLEIPPLQLGAVVLFGAGIGVISALWPAYKASKLNVLESIATD
ncbi:MAG TPA: FtsX-like permease family protein [Acidimicrobiia bacterium]|nr:FtsX-like permease family protein [Acidimicrobiia bacterium]